MSDPSLRFLGLVCLGIFAFGAGILAARLAARVFQRLFADKIKELERQQRPPQ
jgi:hypothetical protein